MADQMKLIITLTKPVTDVLEANVIAEFVKDKLDPYPDVKIVAQVANTIDLTD